MTIYEKIKAGEYDVPDDVYENKPTDKATRTEWYINILRPLEAELKNKFKLDLFEELAIEDNPKREMLFRACWEYGHSAGYYEVFGHAVYLVALIE